MSEAGERIVERYPCTSVAASITMCHVNDLGPAFDYRRSTPLFCGRTGVGALDIVWDTNILIDFLEHGEALLEGSDPGQDEEGWAAELDALGVIMRVWQLRAVRLHVLDLSVTDAKRRLSDRRVADRTRAVREVAGALSLDAWADQVPEPAPWQVTPATVEAALRAVPAGFDRELVAAALRVGAHVFLTRDRGVLRARPLLRACGLVPLRPSEVVDELAICGALDVLDLTAVWWPVPDTQRTSHLLAALPSRE